jgi:hypothetical protein
MTKAQFMEMLHTERARWEAILDEVGEARMTERGVHDEWSVKDIIAHVTWSEREMVGILRERALVGSDLWVLTNDERNAIVFEQNRDRSLDEVLAEARAVYEQLEPLLESLSDEDLNDPSRYRDMPVTEEWTPWRVLAGSTYKHYREHTADIRAWLDTRAAL